MFRTQMKLFYRSPLRLILLAVLFGGKASPNVFS